MKEKRSLLWRWCPQPERMRATRTRPTDRSWLSMVASAVLLSLLAIQGVQMWAPSAVNMVYPNSYGPIPAAQPMVETPTETTPVSQTVTTVSTDHFTIQFTFPESADPGNTIAISTITTAKASEQVDSLSIGVFAYVNRQLAQTTSSTVLTDKQVYSGNTWQTTLTMTVPLNANRSMMIGTVTEVWEETSSYYSSYGYWPYQPNYYPPSLTSHSTIRPHPYDYTMYYVSEPSYVTVQKSSQQTLPLTYVLATTPEYEQLSAQQKQLQQEYDALLAKNNDLSSKYESLRSDYDQLTSKYNQLGSEYNAANLELSNFKTYTYVLIVVTVALAGAFVFLLLLQRRQVSEPPKK
jgi:hypothetical protein